jgi:orotidine-5'-phosphate decarboxylase
MKSAKEKLIVALDLDSAARALELFEQLRNIVGMFKIGSQLFTAGGPDFVRKIVARGGRVFLDLKFHDIPNTVAGAAIEATRLGVSIFNVHAAGGVEMMQRAAEAVRNTSQSEGVPAPKLIAVTVLTSQDEASLRQIGFNEVPASLVTKLAGLAKQSGLDGVVASPEEIKIIRQTVATPGFLIVTPGIRASGTADDQRRVMTAGDAVRAGAEYLVVGRPIISAADPVKAAADMISEIESAG